MSRQEIQAALALRERENFEARYFKPTLASASPPRAAPCLKLSIKPRENILTSLSLSDIFPLNHAVAAKRGGGPQSKIHHPKFAFPCHAVAAKREGGYITLKSL